MQRVHSDRKPTAALRAKDISQPNGSKRKRRSMETDEQANKGPSSTAQDDGE